MGITFSSTIETPQTLSTTNPPTEQQRHDDQLISSFLEVAVGQTVETAKRFLETTNWNIDESINLFLLHKNHEPSVYNEDHVAEQSNEPTTLASMYRPPVDLLFEGRTLEEAKATSCAQNLWLLVNLQSRTEFASHTLNRDLWSNETVSEAVISSFVLWQVYDNTVEGKKISSFYKIDSAPPVVLVIDPVTGQKMRMWSGVIEAQSFVEDLSWFMEAGPHEHIASLIRNQRPETEEDETCYASNYADQVPVPSWGEEFEEEDNWASSNNFEGGPSWGEEFENVETCSSSNNVEGPSWGEEFENVETCSPSNNDDDTVDDPSWGPGFEESAEVEEKGRWIELPDLTEEPKLDCDKSLVCSLCVRFPDGTRKQRRFLKSEPYELLWSFCYSLTEELDIDAFKLVQAIPGDSKTLHCGRYATFEESALDNSLISVLLR